MDPQRLSGFLLVGGSVAFILAMFVIPAGLYQTENIDERIKIIEQNKGRWISERILSVLGMLLFGLGYWFVSSALKTSTAEWVPMAGAVAIIAGSVMGLYFLYLQTTDPHGGYSGAYPTPERIAYWLWLIGQLLIGISMIQAGLPSWLGYLTAGTAVAYGIYFLISGAGFFAPFLLAFVSLAIGIVLLRQ